MAFGLTPVHAHAAVADRGDAPRVLVFGGATRDRDDGAGERDAARGPDDAFAVRYEVVEQVAEALVRAAKARGEEKKTFGSQDYRSSARSAR